MEAAAGHAEVLAASAVATGTGAQGRRLLRISCLPPLPLEGASVDDDGHVLKKSMFVAPTHSGATRNIDMAIANVGDIVANIADAVVIPLLLY